MWVIAASRIRCNKLCKLLEIMKKIHLLLALLTFFYFTNGQSCSPDSLIVRSIKAFETDANIECEDQEHQVYVNRDCTPNDKLLLHLVGTFDNPTSTTYFPILATNHGFKVINLVYPNDISATGACAFSIDIHCFWKYRQEINFGVDTSSKVSVDSINCIANRLLKLLLHLDNRYPSENWGSFLTNSNQVNWSKLVLSGHSQGGGHAAFIAKQFEVDRVLMFASPNDYSRIFSAPAPWTSSESMTQDSNYYAFGNLFDDVVDFSKQYDVWEAMHLLSTTDSVHVKHNAPDYDHANVLYTIDSSSTIFSGDHNAVIIDFFTPVSSGTPVFIPVWQYMLGVNDGMSSVSHTDNSDVKINIFPNPTDGKLVVESDELITQLRLIHVSGKLLKVVYPMENMIELHLDRYSGLIFVHVLVGGRPYIMPINMP